MSGRQATDATLIGELMLAKAMLEESGELLDREDETLRTLRTREATLQSELTAQCLTQARLRAKREHSTDAGRTRGAVAAMRAVVDIVTQIQAPASNGRTETGFVCGLLEILSARHGLELIEEGEPLDPEAHQVIEKRTAAQGRSAARVEVVQPGYRAAGRVLRPALVAVYAGADRREE